MVRFIDAIRNGLLRSNAPDRESFGTALIVTIVVFVFDSTFSTGNSLTSRTKYRAPVSWGKND